MSTVAESPTRPKCVRDVKLENMKFIWGGTGKSQNGSMLRDFKDVKCVTSCSAESEIKQPLRSRAAAKKPYFKLISSSANSLLIYKYFYFICKNSSLMKH